VEEILLCPLPKEELICPLPHLTHMDLRRHLEIIAVAVFVIFIVVLFLLLKWEAVTLSEAVAAIVAVLAAAVLSLLIWAFKPRVNGWLKEPINQRQFAVLREQAHQKEELNLLIKPLYLEFDEHRAAGIGGLIHLLSMPPYVWDDSIYNNSKSQKQKDAVGSIINTMRQHGELAQSQQRALIRQYLEIRRNQREYHSKDDYYNDAEKIVKEIVGLTKTRYEELINVK
jgi:hypothetical protein